MKAFCPPPPHEEAFDAGKIDPNTKDLYQMSALDIAIQRKYYEIAKPLIEHGASVQNIKIPSEFLNIVIAVKIGHVKLVKHVLSQSEVNKHDLQRSLMISIKNAVCLALNMYHF